MTPRRAFVIRLMMLAVSIGLDAIAWLDPRLDSDDADDRARDALEGIRKVTLSTGERVDRDRRPKTGARFTRQDVI